MWLIRFKFLICYDILDSCERIFFRKDDDYWDYAFNCACETKSGQTDPVYQEGIFNLSINCAKVSAKHQVKRYIEISAGSMYSSDKVSGIYMLILK